MGTGRELSQVVSRSALVALMQKAGVKSSLPLQAAQSVGLGELSPILGDPKHSPTAQSALQALEAVRMAALNAASAFALPSGQQMRREKVALRYSDYIEAVKNIKSVQSNFKKREKDEWREQFKVEETELWRFVFDIFDRDMHTPDFQGYLNYVSAVNNCYILAINSLPVPVLDEKTRQQHTYITGSAGSGKTELLKALVLHDVRQGNAAVIIDPTGNFARAVAMWPEFAGKGAERLVYINPKLAPGMVPALNPLDAQHLTKEERGILAGQLTDVLAQVVGKGDWTTQTETVASNCLQVAVNTKGATLRDLRRALVETDKKGGAKPPSMVEAIVKFGKLHHIPEVQDFFSYEFGSTQYVTSKGSLRAKLSHMLRNELFADITTLPSKLRLEELIDARKVIVFDLGAWGDNNAAGAFGRMVIAQLAAIGMRRSTKYGEAVTPVHVFVDEADLFVGPAVLNILSKLRQHGIHLTLAQQTVGYGFEGADKQQLLNNTAIKFAAGDGQRDMLSMMHAPADATRGLKQGQFVGRWGRDGEVFTLTVRPDRLGNSVAMTPAQWEEVVSGQLARYYTRKEETDAPPDDEAPATASGFSPPPRTPRPLD